MARINRCCPRRSVGIRASSRRQVTVTVAGACRSTHRCAARRATAWPRASVNTFRATRAARIASPASQPSPGRRCSSPEACSSRRAICCRRQGRTGHRPIHRGGSRWCRAPRGRRCPVWSSVTDRCREILAAVAVVTGPAPAHVVFALAQVDAIRRRVAWPAPEERRPAPESLGAILIT